MQNELKGGDTTQKDAVQNKCTANIEVKVSDFGPECKIHIDGDSVISLEKYYRNGICEPIYTTYSFDGNNDSRSVMVRVEVYRNWKGKDRLVFTRYIHVFDGENVLNVSYYGVCPVRTVRSLYDTKDSESAVSYNEDPTA